MPPTRRYLRLTAHTVLEVRIYLDNPSDTYRWLLHPSTPALPHIIASVRPLVLPKLHEENARAAGKGKTAGGSGSSKKKGWKDVVQTDEFEVALFLTETSVRHSILKREKNVRGKGERRPGVIRTEGGKMTGTKEVPLIVGEGDAERSAPTIVREDSEEDGVRLGDVPLERGGEDEGEALFVSDDESENRGPDNRRPSRRAEEENADDKKKLALDTTYDGFSIYGRILCLVVKRKGSAKGKVASRSTGQVMMEDWISSTQRGEAGMMEE